MRDKGCFASHPTYPIIILVLCIILSIIPVIILVIIYYVDKPTTVQQGGVGLGYVRVQAKGKQDRRRVTGKTDT